MGGRKPGKAESESGGPVGSVPWRSSVEVCGMRFSCPGGREAGCLPTHCHPALGGVSGEGSLVLSPWPGSCPQAGHAPGQWHLLPIAPKRRDPGDSAGVHALGSPPGRTSSSWRTWCCLTSLDCCCCSAGSRQPNPSAPSVHLPTHAKRVIGCKLNLMGL